MPEPTTTAVGAYVAAASGISMALLGVDAHSLLYAMVGALVAIGQQQPSSRGRAAAAVLLSMLIGAALGNAAVGLFGVTGRPAVFAGCIVGGAGAQVLVVRLIKAAAARIDRFGGDASGNKQE